MYNWLFLVFSVGVMITLLLTGSHSLLAYAFLTTSILLSSFMLYVGDDWMNNRTTGQLKIMLSLALAIIAGLSAWLLLSDLDLWFKVVYSGFVTYVLTNAMITAAPKENVYIVVNDVKEMPRSNQTPQEFVESDED